MPLHLVLLTPRRRFIANRFGLGYQIPLGLVLLGGPLLDVGHRVRLIDNDVLGWDDARLVRELAADPPDAVLLGHTGSTAAHPVAMQTARALHQHFPQLKIIYGGVYPTYAAETILRENPAIDVIVRGEGEATIVALAEALANGQRDFSQIAGITWRVGEQICVNPPRPPIANLDVYRPGWELVNWNAYQLFGFGRSAGLQFSRGCPLTCTYCGQWSFWRRWRHRSPENFVNELESLARDYGVRIVWLADENFAADREAARHVLELIVERGLQLSLNLNMTAADVVRDADLMPLYKRAGVDNIIMGIEALDDATVANVRKNNPLAVSMQAVQILRANHIVSLVNVNVIYGLADETPLSLWRTFWQLLKLDPDILNAVYVTPHFWTPLGKQTEPGQIIQPEQALWTYRNQIIRTPNLQPWQLFLGVKLTEAFFHARPRALWRLLFAKEARFRQILRAYFSVGARVLLAEVAEYLFGPPRVAAGAVKHIPSYPTSSRAFAKGNR